MKTIKRLLSLLLALVLCLGLAPLHLLAEAAHFSPKKDCTREQIVTFLSKADQLLPVVRDLAGLPDGN